MKTTAVRTGDAWVINGVKDRVANAPVAKLFAVEVSSDASGASTAPGAARYARPDRAARATAAGISITAPAASSYSRTAGCRRRIFSAANVKARSPAMPRAIAPQAQALNLGIGRAAYEAALDYAQLRVQGGRRIIEHQAIGTKLAEVAVRLEVARAAIWQAAWACDHPEAFADRSLPDLPLTRIAKVFTSEAIYHATKDAAECFGAMGVMRDMPLQKYVHDALVCLHSGDGNSDAKLRIAEALAGYRRPASAAVLAAE